MPPSKEGETISEPKKYEVVIGGEVLTLIATESEEYIKRLSQYVDKRTSEIERSKLGTTISNQTKMQLIIINIADDYFKELHKNGAVKGELARAEYQMAKYVSLIDKQKKEIDLQTQKIDAMEVELENARRELEEYIEAFDRSSKTSPIEEPSAEIPTDEKTLPEESSPSDITIRIYNENSEEKKK